MYKKFLSLFAIIAVSVAFFVGCSNDSHENSTTYWGVSVSASNDAYGAVSGGGSYLSGATCTVTATPNTGYQFNGWKNGTIYVSYSTSYSFTVIKAVALTADFGVKSTPQNTVTINVANGTGGGTYAVGAKVTIAPNNINDFFYFSDTISNKIIVWYNQLDSNNSYTFIANINLNIKAVGTENIIGIGCVATTDADKNSSVWKTASPNNPAYFANINYFYKTNPYNTTSYGVSTITVGGSLSSPSFLQSGSTVKYILNVSSSTPYVIIFSIIYVPETNQVMAIAWGSPVLANPALSLSETNSSTKEVFTIGFTFN